MRIIPNATQISQWTANATHYGTLIPIIGIVTALFQKGMKHALASKNTTPFEQYLHQKSPKLINAELFWSFIPLFGTFKIVSLRTAEAKRLYDEAKPERDLATLQRGQDLRNEGNFIRARAEFAFLLFWCIPASHTLNPLMYRASYDNRITEQLQEAGITSYPKDAGLTKAVDFSDEKGIGLYFGQNDSLTEEVRIAFLEIDIHYFPDGSSSKKEACLALAALLGYKQGKPIQSKEIAKVLEAAVSAGHPAYAVALPLAQYYEKKINLYEEHARELALASSWYSRISGTTDPKEMLAVARFYCTKANEPGVAIKIYQRLKETKDYEAIGAFNLELAQAVQQEKSSPQDIDCIPLRLKFPDKLPEGDRDFALKEAKCALMPPSARKGQVALELYRLSQNDTDKLEWLEQAYFSHQVDIASPLIAPLYHQYRSADLAFYFFTCTAMENKSYIELIFQGLYEMTGRGNSAHTYSPSKAKKAFDSAHKKVSGKHPENEIQKDYMAKYYLDFHQACGENISVILAMRELHTEWTAEEPTEKPSLPFRVAQALAKKDDAESQRALALVQAFLSKSPFERDKKPLVEAAAA